MLPIQKTNFATFGPKTASLTRFYRSFVHKSKISTTEFRNYFVISRRHGIVVEDHSWKT